MFKDIFPKKVDRFVYQQRGPKGAPKGAESGRNFMAQLTPRVVKAITETGVKESAKMKRKLASSFRGKKGNDQVRFEVDQMDKLTDALRNNKSLSTADKKQLAGVLMILVMRVSNRQPGQVFSDDFPSVDRYIPKAASRVAKKPASSTEMTTQYTAGALNLDKKVGRNRRELSGKEKRDMAEDIAWAKGEIKKNERAAGRPARIAHGDVQTINFSTGEKYVYLRDNTKRGSARDRLFALR